MPKKKTSVILKAKQVQNLKNSIHIHLAPAQKRRYKRKKARVFRTPDVPPPINRIIHQDIVLPFNHGAIRPQGQSNALQSNQAEELKKLYNDILKAREPKPNKMNSVLLNEIEKERDIIEEKFEELKPILGTPIKIVRKRGENDQIQPMNLFAEPPLIGGRFGKLPITGETKAILMELDTTRKTFRITEERGQKLISELSAKKKEKKKSTEN